LPDEIPYNVLPDKFKKDLRKRLKISEKDLEKKWSNKNDEGRSDFKGIVEDVFKDSNSSYTSFNDGRAGDGKLAMWSNELKDSELRKLAQLISSKLDKPIEEIYVWKA